MIFRFGKKKKNFKWLYCTSAALEMLLVSWRKTECAHKNDLVFSDGKATKVAETEGGCEDNTWQEVEVSEVSLRVTPRWWVYGGLRPSSLPTQVQTAIAETAVLSWHGPRPPHFRYHRPNGWRVLPTSWGNPASRNWVPWSTPPSTNVSVSLCRISCYCVFRARIRKVAVNVGKQLAHLHGAQAEECRKDVKGCTLNPPDCVSKIGQETSDNATSCDRY